MNSKESKELIPPAGATVPHYATAMKPSPAGPPSSPRSLLRRATAERIALFFLPIFLLVLICALNFPDELRLPTYLRLTVSNITSPLSPEPPSSPDHLRIFVGVITLANRYELRHLQRLVNSIQPPVPNATVDVKFVICTLTRDEQKVLVGLEILRYDDIMIVDCKENGNRGKTHVFFSTLANTFANSTNPPYDYVMKTDDDTYIRYPELVDSLRPLPREDLYYGHMVPAGKHHEGDPMFMKGMGYVLSWDIVEWIGREESIRNNTMGAEDKLVGAWMRDGGKGRNVWDTKPSDEQVAEWRRGGDRIIDTKAVQYDLPWPPLRFMPRAVSVHRLKDHVKWAQALNYFNVTAGLRTTRFNNITA